MIKKITFVLSMFISLQLFGWGMTGHRTVGQVAEKHLKKRVIKQLNKILDGQSMAEVSNWMDAIRSDEAYDYTHDWHWVTIPEGKTYEEAEKNENGDIIATIERVVRELKDGGLTKEHEAMNIKMLVHLVGDIHQPLHVGTGHDKGGNDAKVKWFWGESNLHRVWDNGMIDSEQYSYSELTDVVNKATKEQISAWQSATVREWAYESMQLRDAVYDLPEDRNLNYKYRYKNWSTVKRRLEKAGIRLAGLLNDIYG